MLTAGQITDFWAHHCYYMEGGTQRRGQAMMNALAKVRPDLYDKISGTEADPFYNDNRITNFKRAVGI